MAVYIIGQAASRENQGMQALSGRSGRRIAEWAQIDQVWDLFHTMNLIREYPGRKEDGKAGDNFSMERAHRKAMVLLVPARHAPDRGPHGGGSTPERREPHLE
jgi:hypothetical protein